MFHNSVNPDGKLIVQEQDGDPNQNSRAAAISIEKTGSADYYPSLIFRPKPF